jgi:hypothetical protein
LSVPANGFDKLIGDVQEYHGSDNDDDDPESLCVGPGEVAAFWCVKFIASSAMAIFGGHFGLGWWMTRGSRSGEEEGEIRKSLVGDSKGR